MKKVIVVDRERYVCDVCGFKDVSSKTVQNCEKSHTCTHSRATYSFSDISEGMTYAVDGIEIRCIYCNTELGFSGFEGMEDDQEKLKNIYEAINGR